MAKIFIFIVMLPYLTITMVHGRISCSEYFTYTIHPKTYKILGRIEILSPPKNGEFYLRVALNATTDLLNETFRLELARPIKESIQAVQQSRHLLYHVHFPSSENFPTLSSIWFNNQQYCVEPEVLNGNIRADIELGHIMYSPNEEQASQNFQPWHRNVTSYRINNPIFNNNDECGITSYYSDSTNNLLPNGDIALPGQWPWVVAIFVENREDSFRAIYNYKCGGTILTNRHVITAGHCVMKDSQRSLPPNMLEVIVGHTDLRRFRRNGISNPEIARYVIHPDYLPTGVDADLAILILKKPVEFNPFIKPICLWSSSITLGDAVNSTGYVVGWGPDSLRGRAVGEQHMARVTIVNQETCLRSDHLFIRLLSNRSFCATSLEAGPCHGDSGSGFVLLNNLTGRYQLRGIISRTIFPNNDISLLCDQKTFIVYEDTAKYIPWIQQQISM
ncbi:PREDICTED: serine protease 29-like isoform X2 [Vollenhovia emeryi]|nr:PREDICTED: serine protease 29-like isoform X2 [Vollenhovia emeryi]XP_011859660.1 PREDICTED: serine protease 29-like isoform X2 [Vollenhovia emeryi]XP_011859661.1 PREDICTED: serine protease 29-like isoform X2 [Vollenhovia emeryi]XP_011859662.1 PREDICTED: serine protease 29-like isoform X2 [Vollenhovia emeryi]XP_011859663.1 PREDICTED: serine protease 29-like isoform X2 [Vollenhovia emeryi]XP_011859664.1 PREDICTED: serine protease 29-like isoform X2 [Vollenhovia emeryi]XP_011859665.1 PREDICTE